MNGTRRLKQIGLTLSDDEFEIIKRAAESEKLALGPYVRNLLFKNKQFKKKPENAKDDMN